MMIVEKASYIDKLHTLAGTRPHPDCFDWPLSHTIPSDSFRRVLTASSPALLSRRLQGKSRVDVTDDYVFAYAAPRFKPPPVPPAVMLFKANIGPSATPVMELAHPFDSGGLRKHPLLRYDKTSIVLALTFDLPWRPELALFVAALFDKADSYLRGTAPRNPDPLAITNGLPSHDPLFFTWEVKTLERITLSGRLAAVVVTTDDDQRPRIDDESYRSLLLRARSNEVLLRVVSRSVADLNEALFDLYKTVHTVTGWR